MKIDYTSKWLLQKIFAIMFLISFLYTLYSAIDLEFNNYEVVVLWFNNYVNALAVLILFVTIFLHSNIGLSSIIDDYFHDQKVKDKILLIKNFFFAVLFFITIFSLIKLLLL